MARADLNTLADPPAATGTADSAPSQAPDPASVESALRFPLDHKAIMRHHRRLRRELSGRDGLTEIRIAVLSGSTTEPVTDVLDLFLLKRGIKPVFYRSDYGRHYEDSVVDPAAVVEFAPNIAYVHTTSANIGTFPAFGADRARFEAQAAVEIGRIAAIADALHEKARCQVIVNTFEPPMGSALGSLESYGFDGRGFYVAYLNLQLAELTRTRPFLVLHDAAGVAARVGIERYRSASAWHSYKLATSPVGTVELAYSLSSLVAGMMGRSKKCLVLDLDNTLWGGIIGDDGPDRIVIGTETARAEAHHSFQQYCKRLKERGILLAVASKNDDSTARLGFEHPDSVLRIDDFAAFHANWDPKPESIRAIARSLNIGLDSLVFVDDNPAERALVAAQLPLVDVPDVGDDVSRYAGILDAAGYFEVTRLSAEDLERTALYRQNAQREEQAGAFATYGEYLDSLIMTAEIGRFRDVQLDRITQLTNKTNQFNLTTRRYTRAEIDAAATDPATITLAGRLVDRFGDNGLISVLIARAEGSRAIVDLWLMSCRVLKRGMEDAMLDALVSRAAAMGLATIEGTYIPTARNGMVAGLYASLGFDPVSSGPSGETHWRMNVSGYARRNNHIKVSDDE